MTIMTHVYNDDNHANEDNDDKRWRCRANYGLCMDAWPCAATVAMDGMAGPGWPGQLWLCVAMHGHAMHRHGWQGLGLRRCMAIDGHGYAPLRIAMDHGWPYMAMMATQASYCYAWPFMAIHGHAWPCTATDGHG